MQFEIKDKAMTELSVSILSADLANLAADTKFQDENGVPKVRYTYCSLHGKLFNCTCRTKDEAQQLCEDWLVTQDRCYIN